MKLAAIGTMLLQGGGEERVTLLATGLVLLAVTGVWLLVIIQAAINPAFSPAERIFWVLLIIGMGCIGALLYFVAAAKRPAPPAEAGGRHRPAEAGQSRR